MKLLQELLTLNEDLNDEASEMDEAKRVFARTRKNKVVRRIRCTAGRRKGKIVQSSADCFKKKDRVRARKARLSSRKTKFIRTRKSRLTRRKAASKMVRRLNLRNRR